jgi:hypothetical protein
VGAGSWGSRETGASTSAGSIAKMLPPVVVVLDEASSLPRMVSGGIEDGGLGPNGWTKG